MTALYSHQGQEPQKLPEKIRLSDGRSRTDVSSYTEEEIADAGFTGPYYEPDYDDKTQKLIWDFENLKFIVEDFGDDYWMKILRRRRTELLTSCDWVMLIDSPFTDEEKNNWAEYRQKLRDLPSTVSLPLPTTEEDAAIIFPISPSLS